MFVVGVFYPLLHPHHAHVHPQYIVPTRIHAGKAVPRASVFVFLRDPEFGRVLSARCLVRDGGLRGWLMRRRGGGLPNCGAVWEGDVTVRLMDVRVNTSK